MPIGTPILVQTVPAQPMTFRNTDPNPRGLIANRTWVAAPYD